MITNGENWDYLVVQSLPGLLKGITLNHKEDFYCLNCFCAYTTKNKLEEHKNADYYADLECLLEKMSTCHNNPEESSNIHHLVIHYLHIAHSIKQKIN